MEETPLSIIIDDINFILIEKTILRKSDLKIKLINLIKY